MRTLFLIFVLFTIHGFAISQETKQTYDSLVREFISDVVYDFDFKRKTALVSTDLDSFRINHIIKVVNKPAIERERRFSKDSSRVETISFTAEEKLRIKLQLETSGKKWLTKVFDNVKITTRADTVYIKGDYQIYNFSKPIFIRGDSMCLFYQEYSCGGLCGSGSLGLYQKKNGKWILFWNFFEWIS